MNRNPAKRSSLFLLELILAILFFSLCSAVCVQMFVKSHTMSTDTRDLNYAINQVTAYAEAFRGSDDFRGMIPEDTVCFDADWNECESAAAVFAIDIQLSEKDGFTTFTASARNISKGKEIYKLSFDKYTGKE